MRRKLAGLLAILILVWALPALGEEAPTFDTLEAAGDFLRQQADQGAAEATFRVIGRDGSDLDNEAQRIREMAGVYSVSTYVSGDQITAKLTCYPGSRIYHAAATGDAGGLDAENVGRAVLRLHPYAVDVSSGIETDGSKDRGKMEEFVRIVREADGRGE